MEYNFKKKIWQNKNKVISLWYQKIKVMKTITFTMQEIWMASRSSVQKNKKTYNRKPKHKKELYK